MAILKPKHDTEATGPKDWTEYAAAFRLALPQIDAAIAQLDAQPEPKKTRKAAAA